MLLYFVDLQKINKGVRLMERNLVVYGCVTIDVGYVPLYAWYCPMKVHLLQ